MTKNVQIIFYLPLLYISMQNNQDKWHSYSWDIADLIISVFDWLRVFLTMSN